jgi:glycine cleavage system H protein
VVAILVTLMILAFLAAEVIAGFRRGGTVEHRERPAFGPGGTVVQEGLFYSPGHTSAALEPNGTLAVGVDSILHRLVGRVDLIDLPNPGQAVSLGDPLFSLKSADLVLDISSPVAGVVEASNLELEESPLLLDPRLRGWAVRVRPTDISTDVARMRIGRRAGDWMAVELGRLRDFFHGVSLQSAFADQTALDGGMPVEGALSKLDAESLRRFKEAFMRPNIG